MRIFVLLVVAATACVKGNPIDFTFVGNGGTIAIDGCPYSVTTVAGAEAPQPSTEIFGPDPTPRLVHLGVVGDPTTSVVAQWRTTDEVTRVSTIRYAEGANLDPSLLTQTASGIEFGYVGTGTTVYRQHQAHICGLSPGTTYSYQVGGNNPMTGAASYSPVYTFHTAPDIVANPDSEVVLGFLGDSRGGYDVWQELVNLVQGYTPDMILFSGDAVTVGITQFEWEDFLGDAESLFASTQLIFANGNHEDNAVNFYSQFAMPGDQQNFAIDWGFAHITVANDTPDDPSAITGAFHDALAANLAATPSGQWKLVMHHQPMFSASTKHGPSLTLQAAWQPLFDQYNVDLVLNGHDHDYEVSKPLVGQNLDPTGTVYIVAGGAGAELYPNGTQFWTLYSESTYSAAILHVRSNLLTFDSFRQDGSPLPTGFSKSK